MESGFDCEAAQQQSTGASPRNNTRTTVAVGALGAVVGVMTFLALGSLATPSSTISFNVDCLQDRISAPEAGMDLARDCVTQVNHHGHIFGRSFAQALVGRHPVVNPRAASPVMPFWDDWTKRPTGYSKTASGIGKDLDKIGGGVGGSFTDGIDKARKTLDSWGPKYNEIAAGITTGYRELGQGIFGAPGDETMVDPKWGMYGRGNWWFKPEKEGDQVNVPGWLDSGDDLRKRFIAFNPALQEDNVAKGWPTKAEPEKLEGDKSVAGRFGLYSYFRRDPEEEKAEAVAKKKIIDEDEGFEIGSAKPALGLGLKYKKTVFPPPDPKKKD